MSDAALDGLRGDYMRLLDRLEANEREFRRLGRAVWRVQEDERRRLARDLHDGIGQNLTALKHRLAQLEAERSLLAVLSFFESLPRIGIGDFTAQVGV